MATVSGDPQPKLVVTVTDLKNWVYCPRVPFYTTFLPQRPTTFKMDAGGAQHEHMADLEERRSLRAYGLTEGERIFHVRLFSERLGVSGLLDMVVVTSHEALPVEYKNTSGSVGLNHRYQLTLYGLLVEEHWQRSVQRGFVYLIPRKRAQEVVFTSELRQEVRQALAELRGALDSEIKPAPTTVRARCVDCEFRRYCPDID